MKVKENILNDDNLEKVSGGFLATEGYNAGTEIVCPNCGNIEKSRFIKIESIATQEGEYFECSCGQKFYRFPDGKIEIDI